MAKTKAKPDLESLLSRAKAGESAAQRDWIEYYQNDLFRFAFYLSKNKEQAEELCQETFISALTSLKQLEKAESGKDWLFRIAKNKFLDWMRGSVGKSSKFQSLDESSYSGDEDGTYLSQNNTADNASDNHAHRLAVRKVLSHFEPEDRALLVMVDMEEMSLKEAGDVLGISESAVKSRVFRLRQEFLKFWKKS